MIAPNPNRQEESDVIPEDGRVRINVTAYDVTFVSREGQLNINNSKPNQTGQPAATAYQETIISYESVSPETIFEKIEFMITFLQKCFESFPSMKPVLHRLETSFKNATPITALEYVCGEASKNTDVRAALPHIHNLGEYLLTAASSRIYAIPRVSSVEKTRGTIVQSFKNWLRVVADDFGVPAKYLPRTLSKGNVPIAATATIGSGGQGEVLKVVRNQQNEAVKTVYGTEETLARFNREQRALQNIQHPGVLASNESGTIPGGRYLTATYLSGGSLKEYNMPEDIGTEENNTWATAVILRVASTINYLTYQQSQILHRDIKPANIVLDNTGNPILVDFGLVKTQGDTQLTKTGTIMGTVDYMSPEQAAGKEYLPQSEIYALACVYYTLLTGKTLFEAKSTANKDDLIARQMKVLHQHMNTEPDLSAIKDINLQKILAKALQKDPKKRGTIEEFKVALALYLADLKKDSPYAELYGSGFADAPTMELDPVTAKWQKNRMAKVMGTKVELKDDGFNLESNLESNADQSPVSPTVVPQTKVEDGKFLKMAPHAQDSSLHRAITDTIQKIADNEPIGPSFNKRVAARIRGISLETVATITATIGTYLTAHAVVTNAHAENVLLAENQAEGLLGEVSRLMASSTMYKPEEVEALRKSLNSAIVNHPIAASRAQFLADIAAQINRTEFEFTVENEQIVTLTGKYAAILKTVEEFVERNAGQLDGTANSLRGFNSQELRALYTKAQQTGSTFFNPLSFERAANFALPPAYTIQVEGVTKNNPGTVSIVNTQEKLDEQTIVDTFATLTTTLSQAESPEDTEISTICTTLTDLHKNWSKEHQSTTLERAWQTGTNMLPPYAYARFESGVFTVSNTVVQNAETGETTIKSKYGDFTVTDNSLSKIDLGEKSIELDLVSKFKSNDGTFEYSASRLQHNDAIQISKSVLDNTAVKSQGSGYGVYSVKLTNMPCIVVNTKDRDGALILYPENGKIIRIRSREDFLNHPNLILIYEKMAQLDYTDVSMTHGRHTIPTSTFNDSIQKIMQDTSQSVSIGNSNYGHNFKALLSIRMEAEKLGLLPPNKDSQGDVVTQK